MNEPRTYDILLRVSERTRQRLDMAKTLIRLQHGVLVSTSWTSVVEWLADTVPIPELLAEHCAEQANPGTRET